MTIEEVGRRKNLYREALASGDAAKIKAAAAPYFAAVKEWLKEHPDQSAVLQVT